MSKKHVEDELVQSISRHTVKKFEIIESYIEAWV